MPDRLGKHFLGNFSVGQPCSTGQFYSARDDKPLLENGLAAPGESRGLCQAWMCGLVEEQATARLGASAVVGTWSIVRAQWYDEEVDHGVVHYLGPLPCATTLS